MNGEIIKLGKRMAIKYGSLHKQGDVFASNIRHLVAELDECRKNVHEGMIDTMATMMENGQLEDEDKQVVARGLESFDHLWQQMRALIIVMGKHFHNVESDQFDPQKQER